MKNSLSPKGLGIALAFIASITMLLLSLVGLAGYGQDAVSMMQTYHVGYDLTVFGIMIGIVEAALESYIAGWLIAVVYNKYA